MRLISFFSSLFDRLDSFCWSAWAWPALEGLEMLAVREEEALGEIGRNVRMARGGRDISLGPSGCHSPQKEDVLEVWAGERELSYLCVSLFNSSFSAPWVFLVGSQNSGSWYLTLLPIALGPWMLILRPLSLLLGCLCCGKRKGKIRAKI